MRFTEPLVTLVFGGEQPEDLADVVDEDHQYTGMSLLDVVGTEDAVVRPNKLSTTEALRLLSKKPLEYPDEWTTVNGQSDEDTREDERGTGANERGSENMGDAGKSDETDDTDIFMLEHAEKKSDEPPPKYLDEDIDEAETQAPVRTDSASNPSEGLPIPCSMKSASSMFTRPLGPYKGGPLHFTPFSRQQLYCGLPTKTGDPSNAPNFSERLAQEEPWTDEVDEIDQDFDLKPNPPILQATKYKPGGYTTFA